MNSRIFAIHFLLRNVKQIIQQTTIYRNGEIYEKGSILYIAVAKLINMKQMQWQINL